MVPLYKKGSVFLRTNYRGVHLTAQVSKVVERVIKGMMLPHINDTMAFGPNQFAYTQKKGARDALAVLVI